MLAKSRLISPPLFSPPSPHPRGMWGRTGGLLVALKVGRCKMWLIEKIIYLAIYWDLLDCFYSPLWNIRDQIKLSVIFNVWLAAAQHFPRTEKQEIISWKPGPSRGWERNLIAKLFQVATNSLAAKIGLKPNDFLNSIAGKEVFQMTHEEVRSYYPWSPVGL